MNIPFVDLKSQYKVIKPEIDQAFEKIFENTAFIGGSAFEGNYAELYGINHCISCANGTDALYLAQRALGLKEGDEVLVPANTWISTSETVSQVGAKPVFVDCDSNYLIDISKIEEKISTKTKAIIPVHLYGQAVNMENIVSIAKKHNLKIIEDCAQSHLSRYNGKLTGTFGDIATFSFYPGKNLGAYGDAGAMITNNDELAEKLRKLTNHGSIKKHIHDFEGVNSRMDGFQAAVLNVKLKYIQEWTKERQENANLYNQYLSEISEIILPKIQDKSEHVYHLYVIQTDFREELIKYLSDNGIASGIHYPTALPFMTAYAHLNHTIDEFPVAYYQQSKIMSLPMFPELTEENIKFISSTIKQFYSNKK